MLSPEQADLAGRIAIASDFAIDVLHRQPAVLETLLQDGGHAAPPPPQLDPAHPGDWPRLLRHYRNAGSARLVWRDIAGLDAVEDTLHGSTLLADHCLQRALDALQQQFAERHGHIRDPEGRPAPLVVFALGKLGGGALNFSSDVDLVYAYAHAGDSDGPRPLPAEAYYARLGQQLAKLLDETTVDGFCHRVDLRLRPFGGAGRVAWSFAALEQYFQNEGRDWERYAWQKARPVAGDIEAGKAFLRTLRPFVYRRYLDYGALEGLRRMKASIVAEVARRELADDIKRGPGGIREVEFFVQALQLIRGGREPALRERRLLPALQALVAAGHVDADVGAALAESYLYLRRLENRLQMLRDAQVHALPEDPRDRQRIAHGLGHPHWDSLLAELGPHRERISAEFTALLAPRQHQPVPGTLESYWRALPDGGHLQTLLEVGFGDAAALDGQLRDFARSPGVRDLSDAANARLQRVMPALLQAAAASQQPDAALRRLLALLHNILRRASYLALLDEQPDALTRLVDAMSRSGLLAERIANHPLLLDELLDTRSLAVLADPESLLDACEAAVAGLDDDPEAALNALNEKRHALSFRIGLAVLDDRQPAQASARQLAWLADAVVAIVLRLALAEMRRAHGSIAEARFAVLGYGSLGGEELGFGSDLDLVFLYEAPADASSDGARPLEASRWFARLAQKLVAFLGSVTAAGKLYEVDVRLRPDGAKGLLVSTLDSFADYQRQRAWTWEHQALVRARAIAGDPGLLDAFDSLRAQVLSREPEPARLQADITTMRQRMRAELDRSDATHFDLKQGRGGLVDLEFLLQARVLLNAHRHPALLVPRDTPGLLDALHVAGLLHAPPLLQAHATLLDAGLHCTLDRRRRMASPEAAEIDTARSAIRHAIQASGLATPPAVGESTPP
ncbi:MAG: bifunctional [glutamate--ammonia ligase]-adenylyl-L-tyrosine phosphorylase/[glutamate--ammonia-ligase] adenylyltransferase [Pseudoxanthomonas suwonensis]|nr:bifunctional [glutamate--ammonia ligase]-adenylyl-L-tyrosine phosphorylase/[glutamate--ammonia-ligase] adenylyltransferase [Pseudoxanthomonas suwonensis]